MLERIRSRLTARAGRVAPTNDGDASVDEAKQSPGVDRRRVLHLGGVVAAGAAGSALAGVATAVPAGATTNTDAVAVSGLTGAMEPTRYVGGTPGGPPTSGTFERGDFVVDVTGQIWICVLGDGTSIGTWVAPGSGRQLGIRTITSNPFFGTQLDQVGFASKVDVPNLWVDVTVGVVPVVVEAGFGWASNTVVGKGGGIAIVQVQGESSTVIAQGRGHSASSLAPFPLFARAHPCHPEPLTPGDYRFKVQAWAEGGGICNLAAGAQTPGYISVVER